MSIIKVRKFLRGINMFNSKFLWFIIGLFIGSSIGFIISSLLVAAGLEERREDKFESESDKSFKTSNDQIK